MTMNIIRIACAALSCLCVLAMGCSDRQTMEKTNLKPQQDVKDLEAKVALILPPDAVLLSSDDGGGRDPSYGFYEWLVFSPSSIKMPPVHAPGGKEYFSYDLRDGVKLIETMMPRRRISQPQSAFGSEWNNDLYTFDGTLVHSSEGDYLLIQRFRKK